MSHAKIPDLVIDCTPPLRQALPSAMHTILALKLTAQINNTYPEAGITVIAVATLS